MKGYQQKLGESLWDYIWRFSQKCHELPKVGNVNVIIAFWSSTSCQTLMHELGRDQLNTTKELHDVATQHASGEEAVGAVFIQDDGKTVPGGSRGAPSKAPGKGAKRSTKDSKKGGKSGAPSRSQLLPAMMTMTWK
jgi:hypothetical protein